MAGQDYKASGIRIFHFKDFCYLPLVTKTTSDPLYHYWTPLHTGMSNAVVSTGKQPWEGVDGFGHYYEIEGTSGQPLDVLKSDMSNNKWASTDQSITDRKTSLTYDVAMKIVNSSSEASFIFQWSISGTNNTAYRLVLKSTGLYLEKQTSGPLGIGWVGVANSLGGVFADTAFTPTPGTFYWFRVYYIPKDVVFRGETIYEAGSIIITTRSEEHTT